MSYLKNYLSKVTNENQNEGAIAFLASLDHIGKTAPRIAYSILQELIDQRSHLKLIASENYSSLAVQLCMGNLFTDKYSEGFPFHRFYAGCDNVDAVENLAVEQAKEIFKAEHAYVQPHSGADANLIAYWAVLIQRVQNAELEKLQKKKLEDLTDKEYEKIRILMNKQRLMGLAMDCGGHLTHGYRYNISSKMMRSYSYRVDPETFLLDYVKLQKEVKKVKPLIFMVGYSAYPRLINFAKMKEIADSVNATLIVDMAHFAGLVAGGVFEGEMNPVPYADIVTSTTHKTLRGPRGGLILCKNHFKETIDKGCPLVMGGPMPHVMAAKAMAFIEANSDSFKTYAHQIVKNSKALAERLLSLGVDIVTNGTDNHLALINVQKSFNLTGKQAEFALRQAHMTVNRNSIPYDKNSPWLSSGIRVGSPALTTLGMKEHQFHEIADIIYLLLKNTASAKKENGEISKSEVEIPEKILTEVQTRVRNLLKAFPLYPEIIID